MNSEVEGLTTSLFLLLVSVINEAMKHIKQYVYNLFSQHVKYKIENFNYLNVAFISYKLTMWD